MAVRTATRRRPCSLPLRLVGAMLPCPARDPHCLTALSARPHSSPTLAGPVARHLALKVLLSSSGPLGTPVTLPVSLC